MKPEHLPPPDVRARILREQIEQERTRAYLLTVRAQGAEAAGDRETAKQLRQEIERIERALNAWTRELAAVEQEVAQARQRKGPPLPFSRVG